MEEAFKVSLEVQGTTAFSEQNSSTFQFLKVVVDGSFEEAFKVSRKDRVQQRAVEQITLTLQFLRVVAGLEVLKVSSRALLVLHPRTRLVPWMGLLQGFFALLPKSKKSAGLGPHSGSELGADFNPWTPAAYADSMVLEEDELGMETESGGGGSDSLCSWLSAFAGLHAVPRAPDGTASVGCAYGDRCTFAHSGLSHPGSLSP